MLTLVVIFALLLISVLVLAAMRKIAGREEEQLLTHVGDPALVQQKAGIVERIDAIEKWGKTLTIVTAVYGLILLCWYLYQGWQQSGQIIR
ncbi:MAG TPA: hypothetical protein VFA04_23925 [Bryobacteraceae bacterium]|jgi:putative heme degradation protein|nr:hypothetical protein [Bryobacteraceae bacterium]